MALIKVGSISDFSVTLKQPVVLTPVIKYRDSLNNLTSMQQLDQLSEQIPVTAFEPSTSSDARGIALRNIKLTKNFETMIGGIFDKTNEIYFLAWAYDLSGEPISFYPGDGFKPEDVIIPIKVGNVREFLGAGINLFAKRKIKGGISLRIQLFESDKKARNLGETLQQTSKKIQDSKLNNLLSAIGTVTGVPGATITLIKEAALELTNVIGIILGANGDEYVDLFEGYYPAEEVWNPGDETHTGLGAEITLNKY